VEKNIWIIILVPLIISTARTLIKGWRRDRRKALLESLKLSGVELFEVKHDTNPMYSFTRKVFVWKQPNGTKHVSNFAEDTLNGQMMIIDPSGISKLTLQGLAENLKVFGNVVPYNQWKTIMPKPSIDYFDD
jgi:hypothetical protein